MEMGRRLVMVMEAHFHQWDAIHLIAMYGSNRLQVMAGDLHQGHPPLLEGTAGSHMLDPQDEEVMLDKPHRVHLQHPEDMGGSPLQVHLQHPEDMGGSPPQVQYQHQRTLAGALLRGHHRHLEVMPLMDHESHRQDRKEG